MEIECLAFRSMPKGLLLGFAKIYVAEWGIEINYVTLFQKNDTRWIGLPSREYQDPRSGEKKYSPYVRFRDKYQSDLFSKAVLDSIDRFLCDQGNKVGDGRQLSLFEV